MKAVGQARLERQWRVHTRPIAPPPPPNAPLALAPCPCAPQLHPTSGCRLQQLIFQMNNSIRHHYALGFHCSSVRHLCRSLRVNTCLTTLNLCNTKLTNRCLASAPRAPHVPSPVRV